MIVIWGGENVIILYKERLAVLVAGQAPVVLVVGLALVVLVVRVDGLALVVLEEHHAHIHLLRYTATLLIHTIYVLNTYKSG